MIRNYRDSTMGSTFSGTDQPPTRSALLTANWRGWHATGPPEQAIDKAFKRAEAIFAKYQIVQG